MRGQIQWLPGTMLTLALGLAAGCNDINTGQDQRSGRGNGDELPTTGAASEGTNGSATDVTVGGPGTEKIIVDDSGAKPGQSTPYGGDGAGASPPVSPAVGGTPSGDSNSGRMTGSEKNIGSDASTNNATSKANLGGPGTGEPPK